MSELLKAWIETSDENARLFAEEKLILQASESILEAMEKKNVSKAQLAAALGKTKSYVTQLLTGSRNMTLRTFADIAVALDMNPAVSLKRKLPHGIWEEDSGFTCVRVSKHFFAADDAADLRANHWNTLSLIQKDAA